MRTMELLYDWGGDVNAVSKQEGSSILYDAVAAKVCTRQSLSSGQT